MVRQKMRYIAVRIRFEKERNISLETSLLPFLKAKLMDDYGVSGLSKAGHLSVVEYMKHCKIALIRCDVSGYKNLLFTLATIGELNGLKCSMSTIWVSGILKKAMKRILKYVNAEKSMAKAMSK
ncbi:hypothetical protein CWI42_100080 [Ordospora colligata]|uniref:Ribonuclease P/MRP protein subunit POP5 n=1 Tax=Ordospora colligata OC4 TaxID=1354746 RepID=A0A0B2UIF2_9MICR|nr:uncharacterized protein M896_100080 [Ordospora colligata OC4]KHN69024.1 hypothetical protein M896_100080 [Ordospora colligata OC4]TBU14305.1 hypothetical protein CWI40_100090 [Ordospora colligata]TBU14370.1 hypothetical protein CWI41_100090 [Ordospora colligata]TBU17986.1 hypothetical protein CWI42_100080 [Ordospora colligata]